MSVKDEKGNPWYGPDMKAAYKGDQSSLNGVSGSSGLITPGDWVARRDRFKHACPCMLVLEVGETHAIVRFIWPDADEIWPVTVEASLGLHDRHPGNPYTTRYPLAEIEKIEGRRDEWPG